GPTTGAGGGGVVNPGAGGGGIVNPGAGGGGIVNPGAGGGGIVNPGAGGGPPPIPQVPASCATSVTPGRAPLRRLTRFEFNNTVADLLGDTTKPGNSFPAEELGSGFGTDADGQY